VVRQRIAKPEGAADPEQTPADSRAPASEPPRRSASPEPSLPRPAAASSTSHLEAAIANLTRLLASTDDPAAAADLVAERRQLRSELEELRRVEAGNVVPIGSGKGRGR
jgi:hypothetical protein